MQSMNRPAAVLLLSATLVLLVAWTGLGVVFDYPQILRQAPGVVIQKFVAGGDGLLLLWTGMTVSTLLMLGAVVAMRPLLGSAPGARAALVFGTLAAVVQAVGLARWVLVVPSIAAGWQTGPHEVWEALFVVVNQYGGVVVGETLGYVFTGLWLIALGSAARSGALPRWTAWPARVAGAGVLFGVLEHAGLPGAVAVNAVAYMAVLVLFLIWGVGLLLQPAPVKPVQRPVAPQ